MAEAVEKILPLSILIDGLIIDKSADFNTAVIKVVAAGIPSRQQGIAGGKRNALIERQV